MGGSGIRLAGFFCGTSQTDAPARQCAAAFDLFALVAPADLIDLLVAFRTFHTHFSLFLLSLITRKNATKRLKKTFSQLLDDMPKQFPNNNNRHQSAT